MLQSYDDQHVLTGLAVAFGVGLLIGIEREQRKGADPAHIVAGVRTFALIALAGAVCTLLGTALIAVGAAFVGLAALASYHRSREADPGLTTEIAMFVAFLLGVLAMHQRELAAGIGVGVALILALKSRLHAFTREVLTPQELHDGLLLIASALIVLPLLPDRAIDPWHVFNPHKLWRLVVLVMAINALGYVAQRALGTRLGLPLSGFAGGFVSATATIGAMGSRAKLHPEQRPSCVAASTLANVATIVQLALVLGALSRPLLGILALPLAASGLTALAAAGFSGFSAWRDGRDGIAPMKGRPFQPTHALLFVALVSVILFVAAALAHWFGDAGALAAAGAAGFADTHAAAASVAQVLNAGQIDTEVAAFAVLIGFTTNTLGKTVVAFGTGGRSFALHLLPGLVAMLAAFAAVLLWR
jgi:uncharacterized membrane protein (DUF4010 family)